MRDGFKEFRVAVISSFASDEPIIEILNAARDLHSVRFYITGNYSRVKGIVKQTLNWNQGNVIFTGFLHRDDYVALLRSVDVVMVLTKRDKTMLAGAYEALAIKKPLITSNWDPLKRYFDKGTIFVNNTPEEIKEAIKTAQQDQEELVKEISQLKFEKTNEWKEKFIKFQSTLQKHTREHRNLISRVQPM